MVAGTALALVEELPYGTLLLRVRGCEQLHVRRAIMSGDELQGVVATAQELRDRPDIASQSGVVDTAAPFVLGPYSGGTGGGSDARTTSPRRVDIRPALRRWRSALRPEPNPATGEEPREGCHSTLGGGAPPRIRPASSRTGGPGGAGGGGSIRYRPGTSTRLIFGMVNSVREWYRADREQSPATVADAVASIALGGLSRASG